MKVPRNKADEIAHRIIKLINRSKEATAGGSVD